MDDGTRVAVEQGIRMFAREAGRRALELQQRLTGVSSKDGGAFTASSIVTEADKEIGALAESFFGRLFPGCAVIQEETVDEFDPSVLTDETLVFVVDPIDGTLFYAGGSYAWVVSVGVFYAWAPVAGCVYAPEVDGLYYTEAGATYLNGRPVAAKAPEGEMKGAIMLRHIKAYHDIDSFPGYTLSYGSVALHLAMVAAGAACACVTSKHRFYDVAAGVALLEGAGAELLYVSGEQPSWRDLLLAPAERAPDFFFACPKGEFKRLSQYVTLRMAP